MIDVSYFKTVEKSRQMLIFGIITDMLKRSKNYLKIEIERGIKT